MPRGAPTTGISTTIVTQSVNLPTTSPPSGPISSPTCPAANGSTYIATNKATATQASGVWQISNPNLSFEILCNSRFVQHEDNNGIMNLQVYSNVSSLNDCLDLCALYNFHMYSTNFPAQGCTGVSYGSGTNTQGQERENLLHTCWLASNTVLDQKFSPIPSPP